MNGDRVIGEMSLEYQANPSYFLKASHRRSDVTMDLLCMAASSGGVQLGDSHSRVEEQICLYCCLEGTARRQTISCGDHRPHEHAVIPW